MYRKAWWMNILKGLTFFLVILAAPLAGAVLAGESPAPYLEFPPVTTDVEPPTFSWAAFVAILIFIVVTTWPFWRRLMDTKGYLRRGRPGQGPLPSGPESFPFWGWVAFTGLAVFWILAWSRFSWFEPFQRHTFFPLWFSMIILLNAISVKLSSRSLLTDRPLYFTLLFPASALFWWIFEYLNRFLNNWYYTGIGELSSWQYFWEASLAFSTVLPAVMSMRFILMQTSVFTENYNDFPALYWLNQTFLWVFFGLFSVICLIGIGWLPEVAYPLVWIAPGLLWISFQKWRGSGDPLLRSASKGDLTQVWASAVAALLCGFFWEMWNFYSEAKWIYNIPAVEGFYIFEMPMPGYAGYLPFGVICALISNDLFSALYRNEENTEEII